MKRIAIISALALCFFAGARAQQGTGSNNTCETAAPFCTGTLYSFPAGVNAGAGQVGPNYGCLNTRPNPAWYYMKVGNSGNIIIQMHSEPAKDIDFCCWGPFTSQDCCDQLTSSKIVSCSYSTAAYETCNIPNGQTGQYYMLVITNFSNQPCNIIFQQTGGTGTTDCSILPPPCTNNSPVCTGQTLQFAAQPIQGASYFWWGPAGFNSTLQNPSIPNATEANSGTYYLRIVVAGQTSSDTSTTEATVLHPVAHAGNDTTIMNGVNTTLHGYASGGSGYYHYKWTPTDKVVNDSIPNPATVNLYSSQTFTFKITDDSVNCPATDLVTVNISGSALAVSAFATPNSICYGGSAQLEAVGAGGTGAYTYQWTGPNGFSSNLPNPTVMPETTSTYQVSAFDGYNTVTGTVTVTVIPLPVADAGTSFAIDYGMYTFLNGSVPGGTNVYFYEWSPADKVIDVGIHNPRTTNLTSTTVYSLVVRDLTTGCISTNPTTVTVEVTGGPLNTNPVALPAAICKGDTTQLFAAAGGGHVGHYTYQWSSVPAGFSSSVSSPVVNPLVTTQYTVTVSDGYNPPVTGTIGVELYPDPLIHLGPADTTVCIYDTVTLDAGNPGSTYLWSNGATTRYISFGTTGIGFDPQHYAVDVVSEHGCRASSSINVLFSFDACTAVKEITSGNGMEIRPNPARDKIVIELKGSGNGINGQIMTAVGQIVRRFDMQQDSPGSWSARVDLQGLPPGVYLVRTFSAESTHLKKLVIE